jgi:hypothetical protein
MYLQGFTGVFNRRPTPPKAKKSFAKTKAMKAREITDDVEIEPVVPRNADDAVLDELAFLKSWRLGECRRRLAST